MKRLLIPILLIAAAAAGFLIYKRNSASDGQIRISGNIEMTRVAVAFKQPGRVVSIDVEEGSRVRKGAIVARMDKESVTRQRERDQAGVVSAEAQVSQLQTGIEWQRQAVEREVEARQAEVRVLQSQLNEALAGARPQELQGAEASLAEARAQHNQATQDWDRAQKLFSREDISRAQYDQARTRLDATASILRQAESRASLVKEGPRREDIDALRAQLARAQAMVKAAENNRLEVRRREQELDTRRAEVSRAKAQVAVVDVQVNDTTAEAPIDGVVLNKNVDAGEVVGAGIPVVTLGDLSKPWVRGYITETQLGRVKLGDRVSVTTDSYPGKTYTGRVSFIASEAEFTPKQIQTPEERVKLVYRIKVELENPNQELKLNMPVDGVIGSGSGN